MLNYDNFRQFSVALIRLSQRNHNKNNQFSIRTTRISCVSMIRQRFEDTVVNLAFHLNKWRLAYNYVQIPSLKGGTGLPWLLSWKCSVVEKNFIIHLKPMRHYYSEQFLNKSVNSRIRFDLLGRRFTAEWSRFNTCHHSSTLSTGHFYLDTLFAFTNRFIW